MKLRKTALSAAVGFGLAATLGIGAVPASASAPSAPSGSSAPSADAPSVQGYTGENSEMNQKFFKFIVKEALKKQAEKPGIQQVTVTYSASRAPSFRSEINRSTQVWNSAVSNVQLREGSGASFDYREGNDRRGSYAYTDGRGNGYIFLDYRQNQQYYSPRVVSHETGHVLGLPDNYSGPCSELMSGGGPGTSCRNDQPNANERARVDRIWANGVAEVAFDKVAFGK
ncbi:snapalysin [Streptomyces boncukensis]|uniref:Extracellular small neutral protease n=1 Tax=Streptomyces boncukensis TaxID=2711219 RepID=A0A6G4WTT3_9ACTN|nr:snapalysin [Streptomyces boncukensis]NGO68686.1 snapalysin [Streptomyces boncukensis]